MHHGFEDNLRAWLEDKKVNQFEALPSILVNNIWWVHNKCIFKDSFIPPEICAMQIINLSKEFEVKKKGEEASRSYHVELLSGHLFGIFQQFQ